MQSNLWALFRQTCTDFPGRVAVIDAQGIVRFEELGAWVVRLAARLSREGLCAGDVVAVDIANERWHLLASLALLRLGCPQVTFGGHDTPEQRRAMIAKCRIAAVVRHDDTISDGVPVLAVDFEAAESGVPVGDAEPSLPRDDTVAMLFTGSGTTGRFKVIPQTHGQVARQALTRAVAAPSGVEYIPSSIEFLYPKKHRLRGVITGYTSLLWSAEHTEIPEICRRFGVDFLRLSPAQAQSLVDADESVGRLPEGISVYVGGSRISGSLRSAFQGRQARALYVEYGATEAGNIAVATPDMHARHPDGVGFPLPGVQLEIVDEDGRKLPPGTEGLIRIRTPGMVDGYLDDDELTARVFRGGWFQGGDRGALTEEGILVFGGRADDMMIFNSINIFPAEIEKVAEGFPGVVDCAAFPVPSAAHGDIPMLAVVSADGCDLSGLMSHCRERLGIRAPRKVIGLSEIPRNPQGKGESPRVVGACGTGDFSLNPRMLLMRERVFTAILANPVAGPRSPDMLARLRDPTADCTFQELGFDSLARMEFCVFLEIEYGIAVTSGEVEGCPSVNAIAAYLAEATE